MRKLSVIILCLLVIMPVFASGKKEANTELIVFGAASLTESLTKIGDAYMAANPGVKISFNFDSSGTLKTQIQEGAPVDIFISAASKQMNQLEKGNSANTEGLDYVLEGTRLDLLENKVTLAVPEGNPSGIKSFDDLIARLKNGTVLLAIGNNDVPVGQYTQEIFAYYNIDENAVSKNLTYGSNVKEVTTQVNEHSVDCGIIYGTDAFSAGLVVVDEATNEMCGQVIYPAAVMKVTKNEEEAKKFLKYLQSDEAVAYFKEVGFSPAF